MATLFDLEPPAESGLNLNDAQRRAITHGEGPLLVIAGAGTGKTRVITERIRHLLDTDGALAGENILALTFTKKAAGEMNRRVAGASGERARGITISTFHAFCQDLLKDVHPDRLALEKVDHWILLRRNMRRLQLEKFRKLAEPGHFLNDFIQFFSRCQDELVSSHDYRKYAEGLAGRLEAERSVLDEDTYKERLEEVTRQLELARAYAASDDLLRERNALAINELVTGAVELLAKDPALALTLQRKFRHILVDEFQDTNIAQLRLLEALCPAPRNIVVVGDNDQAIYRFRGASFGSFKLFLEQFAGWREGQDSAPFRVTLTENYRSTPNILRVATQVISNNAASADFPNKVLAPTRPEGEKIRIVELPTPEDEARWVAAEIERIHKAGRPWRDFAVLYRQHAHRDLLVEELSRRKIPFLISRLSILDHPLVRDVLAYLRLVAKPYDDIACARVLSAPAWQLEPADIVRLAEQAKKARKALYDMLQLPQGRLSFHPSDTALLPLLAFLTEQRKAMRKRTALEMLKDVIAWLEIPGRSGERDRKYIKRLVEFASEWEPKSERRDLPEFLEYLDYYQQAREILSLDDDPPGDAIQLMTVHGAKGLEFSHVFVLRVNTRCFPANDRLPLFEFPLALMKEDLPEGDFRIQEERRLFYVALTRAEDRLTITTVTEKKGKVPVFIEDILMDPGTRHRDVRQLAPKLPPGEKRPAVREVPTELLLFPPPGGLPKISSRIASWGESFRPPIPEPLQLSPSGVATYRSCPQQYLFDKLWSLESGPRGTMTFGRVVHNTIRRSMMELKKGRRLPFEEVQAIYQTEWSKLGFEDEYQEQEYKKDGLDQLRVFHQAMLLNLPEILELEKTFALDLENNVVVSGRIDQINSLGNRDVEIVDYKTGRAKRATDAQKDLQLSIYAIAAREILELNPVRLVFHYLEGNQRQETTRDAKQLAEAQRVVLDVAAAIRSGEFSAKPGFACNGCAFRPICPAHEESLGPDL